MATNTQSLKPGDEVSSWCTKCLEMKQHIVKALVPNKPPRVVCTCPEQKERNYRPNPPKTRTQGSSRKRKTTQAPNPWAELSSKHNGSAHRPYTISENFQEGDAFEHHRYGLGFVIETVDHDKMLVAFEDRLRLLIRNKYLS